MHTVRCSFEGIPTIRFGAVFKNRKAYGAVRCVFSDVVNPTCGEVRCCVMSDVAVRCCLISDGAVRCGFQKW